MSEQPELLIEILGTFPRPNWPPPEGEESQYDLTLSHFIASALARASSSTIIFQPADTHRSALEPSRESEVRISPPIPIRDAREVAMAIIRWQSDNPGPNAFRPNLALGDFAPSYLPESRITSLTPEQLLRSQAR